MRVLEEGRVASDATLELITQRPDRISIATVNDLIYDRVRDRALLQHLATLPEYSVAGRQQMARKLERQG